ncbi:transaldolase family protein [Trichocoleus sp. FACHB-262]|uniref:transaldolase family protein n=1 Tax=Trichocoleus sp. FACHB-262 TaxID=2692869 RepID=UPI001685A124|nr:transaldolase family protein [Trichocoleus sp. FACHB-262]MBD2120669.1 transaldolase [Trichocoleus sp. FACHB-262]
MIDRDRPIPANSTPPQIRLCLDTADLKQWQIWLPTGLFYGITTNPLLLERSQVPCTVEQLKLLAEQAFALGAQEIQLQTWGNTVEALVSTGQRLAAIDQRVVVKVPITQVGATAAAQLIAAGIPITLTAVYAVHQVLIAAALRGVYAAPYLGRINDLGRNGREDLVAMQRSLAGVNSATRLLVASIRSVDDITFLATHGLDTFTFSPAIAAAFFEVAATEQAATDFQQAALRMGAN